MKSSIDVPYEGPGQSQLLALSQAVVDRCQRFPQLVQVVRL